MCIYPHVYMYPVSRVLEAGGVAATCVTWPPRALQNASA
jgi:hypothetical protein